ncbi:RNA guanine-N7 methyltransferase activating subunit [Nymphalis io]|uniref:RNA guanine-N7 methyltransferase activating subunit n=1 Tax=Inachis io TaxID=171585 RepID=UPI002168E1A5|nr:RNA guanine-N7 methyltransferase activating subunit [Nymphalis io]
MDVNVLSDEDKEFLEICEEEFKDRYTEKDEEFMKVFSKEPSTPPILEKWWSPFNSGRRNERRHHSHPYQRRNRDYQSRNNSDHRRYNDYNSSHGPIRSRHSYY